MARYGINTETAIGVSIPELRKTARQIGKNHSYALKLWKTGIHDARILASMVDEPAKVSPTQMIRWAKAFNSWDLCDQVCNNLFSRTAHAWQKASEWCNREEEFVKRAGFTLQACLANHEKSVDDEEFLAFFPLISRGADDDRNYVKKAVNWSLRQIGKRSIMLHQHAIDCANELEQHEEKSAKWIARDALKELTSDQVMKKLKLR